MLASISKLSEAGNFSFQHSLFARAWRAARAVTVDLIVVPRQSHQSVSTMYYQLPKFCIRPWNCNTVKPRNRNIFLFIVGILCHDSLLSSQKHIVDWLICIQVPVVDGFFLVSHCIQNIPWFKSLRNNSLHHVQKVLCGDELPPTCHSRLWRFSNN